MLAYAANRRVIGRRASNPNALLIVIAAHVALARGRDEREDGPAAKARSGP